MEDFFTKVKKNVQEAAKDNKGALIGAVVGYFLSDSKEAQSAMLGAVAGAVTMDNKGKKKTEKIEEVAEE